MDQLLRRSILAVPGDNEKMITKSVSLEADQIFFDWEDAVSSTQKSAAHSLVVDYLNSDFISRVKIMSVRTNGINSVWHSSDLAALATIPLQKLFSVVLPKVTDYSSLDQYSEILTKLEQSQGIEAGSVKIDVQIEGAEGLINVESIAKHPRVSSLSFGQLDFMADMGIFSDGSSANSENATFQSLMNYSLTKIVIAARAAGKMAFDGPSFEVHDQDAFINSGKASRSLGFDGKWVLHPNQISICNSFYSPTADEYNKALDILKAYELASNAMQGSKGASMHNGIMIDEASRKIALKIVARKEALGL